MLNSSTRLQFTQASLLHLLEEPQAMAYQNISAQLSDTDLQEIKTALATIEAKLPFLVHLTVDERRKLVKMGNKSLAFVSNSLTAAQSNPDILPASFDLGEFIRDYQLATTLTEVNLRLQQLSEKVDDTLMAVSSEAMTSSLTVYDYVKTAAKNTPGLKAIADQLSDRFKASRSKATKETPTPEAIA
jgi:hypothetical protein